MICGVPAVVWFYYETTPKKELIFKNPMRKNSVHRIDGTLNKV